VHRHHSYRRASCLTEHIPLFLRIRFERKYGFYYTSSIFTPLRPPPTWRIPRHRITSRADGGLYFQAHCIHFWQMPCYNILSVPFKTSSWQPLTMSSLSSLPTHTVPHLRPAPTTDCGGIALKRYNDERIAIDSYFFYFFSKTSHSFIALDGFDELRPQPPPIITSLPSYFCILYFS